MSIDAIGNFLTIIRNGIMASKLFVIAPYSRMNNEIAQLLKAEGFIKDLEVTQEDNKKYLKVYFKYVNGESVIHELKRISKPGRRVYQGFKDLEHIVGKLGISILTTNRGLMTNKKARDLSVGGEIVCTVW